MVKRSEIGDLLRDVTKATEDRMAQLGAWVADGSMSPRRFYEAMQQEVKLATNVNAALAKGGWAQMTPGQLWGAKRCATAKNTPTCATLRTRLQRATFRRAQIEARAALLTNDLLPILGDRDRARTVSRYDARATSHGRRR